MIQGLDLAIGLMNIGEKCELKIQSRLAYGAKGLQPNVPPNSTLLYTLELLSAEPEEETEELSIEQRKVRGYEMLKLARHICGNIVNSFFVLATKSVKEETGGMVEEKTLLQYSVIGERWIIWTKWKVALKTLNRMVKTK